MNILNLSSLIPLKQEAETKRKLNAILADSSISATTNPNTKNRGLELKPNLKWKVMKQWKLSEEERLV